MGELRKVIAAQFGQAPGLDLTIVLGQRQVFAMLQLRQQVTCAVIHRGGSQRGVAADFFEQGMGVVCRVECLSDKIGLRCQLSQCLQGLWCGALMGDPVRSTDKRQVGHQ